MNHTQSYFEGFDGLPLFYQRWFPDSSPIHEILVVVHGLGGHSDLFKHGVRCLVPQGYGVYALDLRGHGRSPGQRGYIQQWLEFREDLRAFLQFIRTREQVETCFLWGHSMGGTISLDYALHYPESLQGLILSAPALGQIGVPAWKLTVGQVLSRFWPRFRLKVGIDHSLSSRDLTVLAEYATDSLRHEYGTARLSAEFFKVVRWIDRNIDRLEVPLLLLHGDADGITSPQHSRSFFQSIQSVDKTYRHYPNSYHDLHADLNYMEVISDIASWMAQHGRRSHPLSLPLQCLALN
ncbi:lysophospholipase [Altericista sp. CCNU0014]|uniref:alpha/beta hydrolase n=1 Tax=Altericista sp. CCNU0014 TaxID=3082949 RepID=UPI00384C49C4